jgi:hypothetical protein
VTLRNTLPTGVRVDRLSRRANAKVRKALRFTGAGRRITFRIGVLGAGKTVTVRVNAKVAVTAATGTRLNTVVFSATGLAAARATSKLVIR